MFGKLSIITSRIQQVNNLPAVYIDKNRNLYKITIPENYIISTSQYSINQEGKPVQPSIIYSAGYFTLPYRLTSVSFSGSIIETKIWGEIENISTRKLNLGSDAQFQIFEYEFELLQFKVINDFQVNDLDEVFADINLGAFNIKAKCVISGNILKPSESILLLIRR